MSDETSPKPRARRHRGRPRVELEGDRRRGPGPTQARLIATRVLDRVERTAAFADLTLHHALVRSQLVGPDRGLCTELVYGTLRWRGRIDFLLSQVLDRDLEKLEPLVANALRLGAYQILFADRIPATAAVDESVRCVRALGVERATGLVNAVLRRLAREQDTLTLPAIETDPLGHLTHALSLPEWIAKRWLDRFGAEEAARLAQASNAPPNLCVRVNPTRTTQTELLSSVRERYPDAAPCVFAENGISLGRRGNAADHPAFLSGHFTVQDEASQLVVELLDPQLGERVLDTCAAPGTKTTAIAERVGEAGEVLALDRHTRRLGLVARDARRLGLSCIRTQERDATRSLADLVAKSDLTSSGSPAHEEASPLFDRILVDAPCSGLGTLRRNPDARWRLRAGDPVELAEVQRSILGRAAAILRVGGRLVYSTCTLTREENEEVIERFLADSQGYRRVPVAEIPSHLHPLLTEAGDLLCLPHLHDTDGFYAACLERVE